MEPEYEYDIRPTRSGYIIENPYDGKFGLLEYTIDTVSRIECKFDFECEDIDTTVFNRFDENQVLCSIDSVSIDQDHRRRGFGFELVDHVLGDLRASGVRQFILRACPDAKTIGLTKLSEFYAKFGFRKVQDLGPDGLLMILIDDENERKIG